MAIRIEAQLAKKLPIPGADYSSQQASISISAEVSDPTQVATQAARLYALAEAAVDAQLQIADTTAQEPRTPAQRADHSTRVGQAPQTAGAAQRASYQRPPRTAPQAYRGHPSAGQRRGSPPPISDAQRRLLTRLLNDTPDRGQAWLETRGIERLNDIDMAEASALIDELKAVQA